MELHVSILTRGGDDDDYDDVYMLVKVYFAIM